MAEDGFRYEPRAVAFMDIIGFENLVRGFRDDRDLFSRVSCVLRELKYVEIAEARMSEGRNEVSVFSDSVVVSGEENDAFSLVWRAGWLQCSLLRLGVLLRGGIAVGPTVHQDGILFGEGLLNAYRIESKAAVYPRIVISEEAIARSSVRLDGWLARDADGLIYVDPFRFNAAPPGADELLEDGHDPREVYLDEVRQRTVQGLEQAVELDHVAKQRWVAARLNEAMERHSCPRLEPIDLRLESARWRR